MSCGDAIPEPGRRLRLLYLEDEPQDAELSLLALQKAGYEVQAEVVAERDRFLQHARRGDFDLVLVDYRLRGWTGLEALRELRSMGSGLPVIVVSGTLGDDTAVECVKQGACDYVLKHRLVRLPIAVQRTLRTRELQLEREAAEREREQLHREMAERERKYRELFELANEAILIFEPEGEVILEANPCACETYGFAHHELVGMSLKALTRDVPRGERQVAELLQKGSWRNFQSEHVRKDGQHIHMLASSKVIEYSGRQAVLTVIRDVSELKQAQDALRRAHGELEQRVEERTAELARVNGELRQARDEWQTTFDCMSDAITVHDPTYHILRCNRAFRELFPGADLQTAKCYELVHGTEGPPEDCPMARTLVSGRSERCEMFEPHLGRYISVRTDPICDADGNLAGIVHAVSDISERKEIERMKNDFVATVSHELRTPLTSLRGFVELMLKRDYPAEKRREFLGVILRESQRLSELVNDVLDLQRIESGQQVFRFEPVSLAEVVAHTAEVFGGDEAHPISIDIPPEMPLVFADPELLHQVIGNLVSNALKYSPKGGRVHIGARAEPGQVLVWVSDEGIGIPPELLGKIFSRFYRVERGLGRKIGGSGLGLALVKDIVEAHGGKAWAESVLRKGSTFYFTLKLAEPAGVAA